MGLPTFGSMGVDWEQRVRFDRLREQRLARIASLLAGSELGALLCFDMVNIRYITATHIGTWAQDKLNRFCLLPQGDLPIMWDFGSAARHHQLYNPWLGEGRSRAGIATMRGAMSPSRGRAEDVARKIRIELEQRGLLSEPVGVDAVEPAVMFALQAEGVQVVDGQQLMQQARMIKTEDEITLLNTACMMVDAAYEHLYGPVRPAFRENDCVALVNKVLYEMGSEFVEGVNAISGERCSPHPHVYTDRALRPGDPALLRHPAQLQRLPHLLLPHVCRRQRLPGAGRRLQRYRYYLDAAINLIRPGVTTAEVAALWPKAQDFGFPNEEAAFALQFGHGVGLAVSGETHHQPARLARPPRTNPRGHGLRPRNLLARHRRLVAARIEEQLVVTNTGSEIITRFPAEDLLIAGKPYYTTGGTLPLERDIRTTSTPTWTPPPRRPPQATDAQAPTPAPEPCADSGPGGAAGARPRREASAADRRRICAA